MASVIVGETAKVLVFQGMYHGLGESIMHFALWSVKAVSLYALRKVVGWAYSLTNGQEGEAKPGNFFQGLFTPQNVQLKGLTPNHRQHVFNNPAEAQYFFFTAFNEVERMLIVEHLKLIYGIPAEGSIEEDYYEFLETFNNDNEIGEFLITDISNNADYWLPFLPIEMHPKYDDILRGNYEEILIDDLD